MHFRAHLIAASVVAVIVAPLAAAQQNQPVVRGQVGMYSGPGSCAASNCHGGVAPKTVTRVRQNEYSIWAAQDKHARAYAMLSNPVSMRMAKIQSFPLQCPHVCRKDEESEITAAPSHPNRRSATVNIRALLLLHVTLAEGPASEWQLSTLKCNLGIRLPSTSACVSHSSA